MAGQERLIQPRGKLVLFLADGTTLDIPLDRERVTVGRRPGNDLCLPYAAVSAAHAVFVATPKAIVLEDLGSTNGTMINGKRTLRQVVHDGDRIEIGRQQLVYLADVNAALPESMQPEPAAAGDSAALPADDGTPPAGADDDTLSPLPADAPALAGPVLKVLSGPRAGRTLVLAKEDSLVGRAGVQVVAVRRAADGCRLVLAEGAQAPRVNGTPVPPDGVLLQPDDAIEIADARIVFLQGEAPLTI
jgi:hypothetical protein